jgi:AraC family transcriptional regulator of adaptative response/methylated-DNA-[protein]-cysteine methyltransferase
MLNQPGFESQSEDYLRIERAIEYLAANFKQQPNLEEIAASVHLSKFHFQRLFRRWAGISPTQFLQYLTLGYAKERLRASGTLLETALDAGLSGPSRLHDLFVTFEAITPGEYKNAGSGLEIAVGYHPTPFGECLLATTPRGVCALRFTLSPDRRQELLAELKTEWPLAHFVEAAEVTAPLAGAIFSLPLSEDRPPLHLLLKGTNFQIQVWQALLAIPAGAIFSYQQVASLIGDASATRAVAGAIARNPVAYVIPCHRVISKSGNLHRYRWGAARKQAMLGWEATHLVASSGEPEDVRSGRSILAAQAA